MEFTDKYSFSLKRTIYECANMHSLTHLCPSSRRFLSWLIHVILWMQVLWVVRPSVAFGGINLLHMLTVDHRPQPPTCPHLSSWGLCRGGCHH